MPLPTIARGEASSDPPNRRLESDQRQLLPGVPNLDKHMFAWFTIDRTVAFLLLRGGRHQHASVLRLGVRQGVFFISPDSASAARVDFLCLHSKREEIAQTSEKLRPLAMIHHGSATDQLFAANKLEAVHDYVKTVHDRGLLAGVSTHNPACVQRIADEGWEVDFFMTCLYFMSRRSGGKDGAAWALETVDAKGPFFKGDPAVMTAVVRQVKQPCLAFKILAAGRMGSSPEKVRNAFRFAYENIKPSDGVIVGMFPQYFDEVNADVAYALGVYRATPEPGKGTGPCFRPASFSQNTLLRRKMDQSPAPSFVAQLVSLATGRDHALLARMMSSMGRTGAGACEGNVCESAVAPWPRFPAGRLKYAVQAMSPPFGSL